MNEQLIIEAMAARVPIIATNIGGPLESLNKGDCGILVDPKNSDLIVKACEKYSLIFTLLGHVGRIAAQVFLVPVCPVDDFQQCFSTGRHDVG